MLIFEASNGGATYTDWMPVSGGNTKIYLNYLCPFRPSSHTNYHVTLEEKIHMPAQS